MTTLQCDVAIVGAGPAGLATAIALAHENFATCLIGSASIPRDGRTIALLDGSVRFLGAIGLWPSVAPHAAALSVMRIIDDTNSLFRAPALTFHATEIGLKDFGFNVENADLVEAAARFARSLPRVRLIDQSAAKITVDRDHATILTHEGTKVAAKLVIGADGRNSLVRRSAAIHARTWSYRQMALTAVLAHARPHEAVSTEFHTRRGPFTLVPLPRQRSSLVWVTLPSEARRLAELDDREFARAAEAQAQSVFGAMQVDGARGLLPLSGAAATRLVGERAALLGEAAHVFPPIGAQGLNLGLREAAGLRDHLVDARARGDDLGGRATLAAYQSSRALDAGLRTAMVDGLNRTLLAGIWPADFLRGAGMVALALCGPLRRTVMREGLTPSLATPRLMRRSRRGGPAIAF